MVNFNAFDALCATVETYNEYITQGNRRNLSYDEKRGLFYNFLRNRIGSVGSHRKSWCSLLVRDLNCTFDVDGRITSLMIHKLFGVDTWTENGIPVSEMLNCLKYAANRLYTVYPTRELNEMALIINSI